MNMPRHYCLISSLVVIVNVLGSGMAWGQIDPLVDPFGGQAQAARDPALPARSEDRQIDLQIEPARDFAVDAIVQSDPQTAAELIRAIDLLLNINRDDLALGYIQKLTGLGLDDEQNYQLYKQAGSATVFRIAVRDGLGTEGAELARSIFDGADRFATDHERINTLVEEVIRNEDKYQRSRALTDLRLLGDIGAARLAEKLVDPDYEEYQVRIRQAIGLFGASAEGPLMAGLRSNSLKLQVESIYLLGNVRTPDAVETLMLPMLSSSSTPLQKELAVRSIKKLTGRVPDKIECESRLHRSAKQYLMDEFALDRDAGDLVKWWRWDAESRSFSPSWLPTRTVARIRGFRRASDLMELNPRVDYRQLYWVARLETAKLTAGIGQSLPGVLIQTFTESLKPEETLEILGLSIDMNRIPAAVAACEVIGATGNDWFLNPGQTNGNPLIRALESGSVRLKSAACRAIGKIDPVQSFAGSSTYLDSLVFLSRSAGINSAVVGHVNLEQAQSIAALTGRRGYRGYPATSAQELFRLAQDDSDLQLIIVTDKLNQPGFSELVQTLRSTARTRLVPILLMVEPENMTRAERLAERFPNTLVSPYVVNDVILARQIDNLNQSLVNRDAGQVERGEFAARSLERLGKYASQPDRYPFFDVLNHRKRLMRLPGDPSVAADTCRLLGGIATPEAQISLLDTASNQQLPVAIRQVAAESFAAAVKKRGLLLSREQILEQYKRYNASEKLPEETQQILGYLLDAMEKKR